MDSSEEEESDSQESQEDKNESQEDSSESEEVPSYNEGDVVPSMHSSSEEISPKKRKKKASKRKMEYHSESDEEPPIKVMKKMINGNISKKVMDEFKSIFNSPLEKQTADAVRKDLFITQKTKKNIANKTIGGENSTGN